MCSSDVKGYFNCYQVFSLQLCKIIFVQSIVRYTQPLEIKRDIMQSVFLCAHFGFLKTFSAVTVLGKLLQASVLIYTSRYVLCFFFDICRVFLELLYKYVCSKKSYPRKVFQLTTSQRYFLLQQNVLMPVQRNYFEFWIISTSMYLWQY